MFCKDFSHSLSLSVKNGYTMKLPSNGESCVCVKKKINKPIQWATINVHKQPTTNICLLIHSNMLETELSWSSRVESNISKREYVDIVQYARFSYVFFVVRCSILFCSVRKSCFRCCCCCCFFGIFLTTSLLNERPPNINKSANILLIDKANKVNGSQKRDDLIMLGKLFACQFCLR